MKQLLRSSAAGCLLILSNAAMQAAQSAEIKGADACGYVVDTKGSVVPEATVKAMTGEKTVATATTLSDGSFHFQESINSRINVTVSANGFAPATQTVDHVKSTKSDKKCKSPIYAVLAAGNGASFITTKKKLVPRPAR